MNLKTKEQHINAKYMNALLYACTQREFTGREFHQAFKINHNVLTAMNELGIVFKFRPGHYRWQLMRKPLQSDVESIRKRITAYNTSNKQESPQLTIKPIRKAPVSTPEPIVKEAEYDTSNSKILLILAVGAMVGFMISTIIWK
jgi:hypothetical protein